MKNIKLAIFRSRRNSVWFQMKAKEDDKKEDKDLDTKDPVVKIIHSER